MAGKSPRINALHRLGILDTPPEAAFDRITQLAARLFNASVACVTLVDDDRYYFKSAVGASTGSTPLEPGFCGTTIESDQVRVVNDTTANDLTKHHSLVCAAPHLRFYAGAPLVTSDGHAVGTLCVMDTAPRDFSDKDRNTLKELGTLIIQEMEARQKLLDDALASETADQIQRLDSLAKISSGIGHDFNNYLMAIMGNLDLIPTDIHADATHQRLLDNTKTAAARASELAQQLLTLAGERTPQMRTTSLQGLLRSVVSLVTAGLPETVKVVSSGSDADIRVHADPSQLRQALVNLLLNAAESYADQQGVVEISMRQVANEAHLQITDHGCGIEPDIQPRVFDPFFSTKTSSRGLGLATAQRIVSNHGGTLELFSGAAPGTRCTITLPRGSEASPVTPDSGDPDLSEYLNQRTVLIVDDEPDVRRFLVAAVTHLGCKALEAAGGHEAIALIHDEGAAVDAVLLDTSMPGLSGDATLRLMQQQSEPIPTIVMSGHDLAEVKGHFVGLDVSDFLQKPFRINQLKHSLKKASTPSNA
ncbi:MAG: ATP-binding protein [Lysobacterales bacterium]